MLHRPLEPLEEGLLDALAVGLERIGEPRPPLHPEGLPGVPAPREHEELVPQLHSPVLIHELLLELLYETTPSAPRMWG